MLQRLTEKCHLGEKSLQSCSTCDVSGPKGLVWEPGDEGEAGMGVPAGRL